MMFAVCLFLAVACNAHITFVNSGTAVLNRDTLWDIQIPHSEPGKATVQIEVSLPQGVTKARPRNKVGWNTTVEYRALPAELQYTDHGVPVTQVISKITFTASSASEAIQEEESEIFQFSITLGCRYNDTASNTFWSNNYAMWFPTKQFLANTGSLEINEVVEWTGVVKNNEVWGLALPSPSPYLLIADWSLCNPFVFFGVTVPPVKRKTITNNEPSHKRLLSLFC